MQIPTIERRPAARLLAPGRTARPGGVPLRRLARRARASRGGRCCRSGRPTGPARRTRRSSAFAAWRGLPRAAATRAVTADELEAFVARERYWIADWAAFAGAGAIADQVRFDREWSALRRYAAERGVRLLRRRPDLRRPRRRRRRGPSGALPARRRRRRAARRAAARSASSGATRSTTGGAHARAGLPLVDRAASGARSSSTTSRGSTTSAGFVSYWAVPERAPDGEARTLAARAGRRALPTRPSASSGRCRWSPRTSA